jgi:hypothetical protein
VVQRFGPETNRSNTMQSSADTFPDPTTAMRDVAARATVALGLIGLALIHVIDAVGKYSETRYLFWMYVGLILSSVALAGALLFTRSRLALPAAIALVATALAGFLLNRTVGLPNATGDIGNWTEPIGLANMFVEGTILFVAIPAYLLAARDTSRVYGRTRSPELSPASA